MIKEIRQAEFLTDLEKQQTLWLGDDIPLLEVMVLTLTDGKVKLNSLPW